MKRFVLLIAVFLTAFSIASAKAPKYVFFFIGDGMGLNSVYGAELLTAARNGQKFPQPSTISLLPYRTFVTTYSANSLATDSAAAGTALATGVKTNNSMIGRDPEGNDVKNLVEYAREAGWNVLVGKDAFKEAAKSHRTICIAYEDKCGLPYAIQQPDVRLEDLYKAGLDNMMKYHRKGFFMMVESANIDHAAHENDVYAMLEEVNDFNSVVAMAVDFYKAHPDETLIVVTADHETSGLTLCSASRNIRPGVLLNQKVAQADLSRSLKQLAKTGKPSWEDAKSIISEVLGLWKDVEVDYKEEYMLREIFETTVGRSRSSSEKTLYASNERLASAAVTLLAKKAGMVMPVHNHSAAQVAVFSIGVGAEKIAACRGNTDIPKTIRKVARY